MQKPLECVGAETPRVHECVSVCVCVLRPLEWQPKLSYDGTGGVRPHLDERDEEVRALAHRLGQYSLEPVEHHRALPAVHCTHSRTRRVVSGLRHTSLITLEWF